MTVRFLRVRYFIWTVVPVATAVAAFSVYHAWGLPHVAWSYSWVGSSYDPFAERHYTRCTFVGPYGSVTVLPRDGNCPWFRFVKREER